MWALFLWRSSFSPYWRCGDHRQNSDCNNFSIYWPDPDLNKSRFSFELRSFLPLEEDSLELPLGLKLVSRVFFDLDSDLEEPRITLEIFCIVRSPMDSVRVNFGEDLISVFKESRLEAEATLEDLKNKHYQNKLSFFWGLSCISLFFREI